MRFRSVVVAAVVASSMTGAASVTGVASLIGTAHSADLPGFAPPGFAPPVFAQPAALSAHAPWAGLYAGSIYGAAAGSFRSSAFGSHSVTHYGYSAGALAGFNLQSGSIVYGVEGDLTLNTLQGHNDGAPGLVPTNVDSLDASHVRARIGYDLGPFLPFVAAGAAFGDVYQSNQLLPRYGDRRSETGFSVGAGLDWRVTAPILGPVVLRAEYIYDALPGDTFVFAGGPVKTRNSNQYLRVGLIVQPGAGLAAADPMVIDWSGPYAGVSAGGMWAQPKHSLGAASSSYDANGEIGGVFLGRNYMFGRWALGYEAATELTNVTGSGAAPGAPVTRFNNYFETNLRGRAGYAFGRFLPYVTAGAGWGRGELRDLDTGSDRAHISSMSLIAGGGVEYKIDRRWSLRGEYLYDASLSKTDTGLDGLAYKQERPAQSAQLGLAYYFH